MNIFNKITLQTLKKNRTRTIVTIIGIILSAAMICAVTTFASSMQNYALRSAIYREGDWHGSVEAVPFSQYEEIAQAQQVQRTVYMQRLGYAPAEGSTNPDKPYLYVLGGSLGAEDMLSIHITQGRYPATGTELLLPEHLETNGEVRHKIGDTLELPLGERVSDGFRLGQNNPLLSSEEEGKETLEIRCKRTFTVVGFYERPAYGMESYTAPGYTAITVADETPSQEPSYDVYFKMHKAQDVYSFMEENRYAGQVNTDVLLYSGISRYDSFSSMLLSLCAIVIVLIMFGSVSLIYNAFSISVSERTKQFGLLSSIGATKKQLRKSVYFEAFCVALIGIPLGVGAGIGGIGVTLVLIGDKFRSLGMDVEMRLSVSPVSVVAAAVIALITVLISAWIPSKRAMRVSAVEAIRQNEDIKIKGRRLRTSFLTYRLFGLPGMLASKYYKRNRKKYRATVMSLFMSIVLFVSSSAFTGYLMESASGGFATNGYDLAFRVSAGDMNGKTPEALLEAIKPLQDITAATYTQGQMFEGFAPKDTISQSLLEGNSHGAASSLLAEELGTEKEFSVVGCVYFIPDGEFMALLEQYKLKKEAFMNPREPLAITVDCNTVFDREQGKFVPIKLFAGDQVEITCFELRSFEGYHYGNLEKKNGAFVWQYENKQDGQVLELPYQDAYIPYTLKSGKTVYETPYYLGRNSGMTYTIYPISARDAVMPEGSLQPESYEFYMCSDNHALSFQKVKDKLAEMGVMPRDLYDYAESVEGSRNFVTIIRVFSYGFIVLISLIAAANVFNTISTNIALRRREFAMLKSVGMTEKGFNKMMNYECLLYGTRALLYGIPVSVGVTYLIWQSVMEGYQLKFHLPWTAMGIAVLSVFAVVFATMMYAMGKIKKDNPIDALKNENI